ncbi:archease [Candidatus Methylocalor cossyra]|uniref:Protein archease n=1 Tax=Candidatus Methylocalor cossyra TaxID=3108543 RepID=A0ABP1C929_9GAMM
MSSTSHEPGRDPRWELFPHAADMGVRGYGGTLEEAFAQAALALSAIVCDPGEVQPVEEVPIQCQAQDAEMLLVEWLNALIYAMAVRHLLFGRYQVQVEDGRLQATAYGEPVDRVRHQPAVEIKGATYTELKVRQEPDGHWIAQCVVDV